MNCFNHPDKPAVGFCKSCCKGLCSECAAYRDPRKVEEMVRELAGQARTRP